MDISAIPGTIWRDPGVADQWKVTVPLVFSDLDSGPPGMLQVAFGSPRKDIVITGPTRVFPYEVGEHGDLRCSGSGIGKRPVVFQDDGTGKNTLVFETSIRFHASDSDSRLRLSLLVTFTNLAFLSIPLRLDVQHASGVLNVVVEDRPVRGRWPALVNLALVSGTLVALGLLARHLDSDVYATRSALRNAAVLSAIAGSALTFLGLSLGRVRAWIAAFSSFLSVLRWPELHLNPSLLRVLQKRSTIVLSLAVAGTACWFGWQSRSVEVPEIEGATLIDQERGGRPVTQLRILRTDLNRPQLRRFVYVCSDMVASSQTSRRIVAFLQRDGALERTSVAVTAADGRERMVKADDLLSSTQFPFEFNSHRETIHSLVCTQSNPGVIKLGSGEYVQVEYAGDELQSIRFGRSIRWSRGHLEDWIRALRAERLVNLAPYGSMDWDLLAKKRYALISGLFNAIKNRAPEGLISPEDLVGFVERELSEAMPGTGDLDRQVATRAAIEINAVWTAFAAQRLAAPTEEHVDRIVKAFEKVFGRAFPGNAPFVSLVEAVLAMQSTDPGLFSVAADDLLQKAVANAVERGGAGDAFHLTYAAVFLTSQASDSEEAPQWCSLREKLPAFSSKLGTEEKVRAAIITTALAGFGWEESERSERMARVDGFWKQTRRCSGGPVESVEMSLRHDGAQTMVETGSENRTNRASLAR